ncbi:MAG: hypothetical protein EHM34_07450 [Nitrosopumilales archaeon]|nr:MAG: hypothetical protein EHM34_07450 [Nitrosopumilales archaeon]
MQKWEYLMVICQQPEEDDDELVGINWEYETSELEPRKFGDFSEMANALGSEGWELVSTSTYIFHSNTLQEFFYFKRSEELSGDEVRAINDQIGQAYLDALR